MISAAIHCLFASCQKKRWHTSRFAHKNEKETDKHLVTMRRIAKIKTRKYLTKPLARLAYLKITPTWLKINEKYRHLDNLL